MKAKTYKLTTNEMVARAATANGYDDDIDKEDIESMQAYMLTDLKDAIVDASFTVSWRTIAMHGRKHVDGEHVVVHVTTIPCTHDADDMFAYECWLWEPKRRVWVYQGKHLNGCCRIRQYHPADDNTTRAPYRVG